MGVTRSVLRSLALASALMLSVLPVANASQSPSAPSKSRPNPAPSLIDNTGHMDVNNLDMFVTNHGSLAYDIVTGNGGLIYPRGTSNTAVFAAGLWIGAQVNGETRVAVGEYSQEYAPGPMVGGTFLTDQANFHNFRIASGQPLSVTDLGDYMAQGGPLDSLGQAQLLGDATIWSVFNDADASRHTNQAGSTQPLGIEVQQSVFAFNRSGALGDVIFVKWLLINKGGNTLNSAYVSFWSDPDLGNATDDLVGCDTTLSLGYCYNATNADGIYGSTPPAVGFDLLKGPTVGGTPLGMTSFNKYINGIDPASEVQTYNYMRGLNADGTPIHILNDPNLPASTFQVSGLNPGGTNSATNWIDFNPADRRLQLSAGPFTMAPGDTQEVVTAIIIGQGSDRLSSIMDLKYKDSVAQTFFDHNFNPVTTAVSATVLESDVQADRVRLTWLVPGAPDAAVFRRDEGSDWAFVGNAISVGGDRLQFEDATVRAGLRYGYRLLVPDEAGNAVVGEVWVEVPGGDAPSAPAIRIATANPSAGPVGIRYGIPAIGRAQLDVYDVAGRRIATLTRGRSTAGWHSLEWNGRDDRGRAVASGIYLLRLVGDGTAVERKVTLLR